MELAPGTQWRVSPPPRDPPPEPFSLAPEYVNEDDFRAALGN